MEVVSLSSRRHSAHRMLRTLIARVFFFLKTSARNPTSGTVCFFIFATPDCWKRRPVSSSATCASVYRTTRQTISTARSFMRFATLTDLSPSVCAVVMWVAPMLLCRWVFQLRWILPKQGIHGCTFSKQLSRFRLELFDHANWQTHSPHRHLRYGDGFARRNAAASGTSRYWLRHSRLPADERSSRQPQHSYSRTLRGGKS